jgi:excisionase family DNA binding protein
MQHQDTYALFVRLPLDQASKLDRAARSLGSAKKDLVAGLVDRYVDPDTPGGLEQLRALGTPSGARRRVIVEADDAPLAVGGYGFRPAAPTEVLTPEQAAELLQVDVDAVLALAAEGTLPGRQIGEEWRFARSALIDWLAKD